MIGKTITSILTNDSALTALVGTKIYPILMEENTKLPAISYLITEINAEYFKQGWAGDAAHFQIRIFAKSYAEANTVALAVRSALERANGTYDTTVITAALLEGYTEDYDIDGDAYQINLSFRTNIKQY